MPQDNTAGATAPVIEPPKTSEGAQSEPSLPPKARILTALGVPDAIIEQATKANIPDRPDPDEEDVAPQAPPIDTPPAEITLPDADQQVAAEAPAQDAAAVPDGEDEKEEDDTKHYREGWVPVTHLEKRVGKLTKKWRREEETRLKLEAERAELQEKLEKANKITLMPSRQDPLADVDSIDTLKTKVDQAKAMRDWCWTQQAQWQTARDEGLPIEPMVVNQGTEKEEQITPAKVTAWAQHYTSIIEAAPEKQKFLDERVQNDNYARVVYPQLFDQKHPAYQDARQLQRDFPDLVRRPDMNTILGDFILGRMTRLKAVEEAQKTTGVPQDNGSLPQKPPPPIAPRTPKPPSASVTPSHNNQVEEATQNVVKEGGDMRSLTNLVGALRAARQQKQTDQGGVLV